MSQNLQELNSWLQMNWSKNMNTGQSAQALLETEMELKLLKQERHALSETIAQMNVQKRGLNEEKLSFEAEKQHLEHEKQKVHNLQVLLNLKMADADEMKKVCT